VSYVRVSRPGKARAGSGLRPSGRRSPVIVAGGCLLAKYVEVESGRKNNRPQLLAALADAERQTRSASCNPAHGGEGLPEVGNNSTHYCNFDVLERNAIIDG
jgi:hypothetical protein